jgi:hypothetical protein
MENGAAGAAHANEERLSFDGDLSEEEMTGVKRIKGTVD